MMLIKNIHNLSFISDGHKKEKKENIIATFHAKVEIKNQNLVCTLVINALPKPN